MIQPIIYSVAIFLMSVVVHEIGHMMAYYYIVGKVPEVNFNMKEISIGKTIDYSLMNKAQHYFILESGIRSGAWVLILGKVAWWIYPLYIWGSLSDIKNMYKIISN